MNRLQDADNDTDAPAEPTAGKSVAGAQTLERGLELLELAVQEPTTVAELMRLSGMPRGIVYRLVSALTARGFLTNSTDGRLRGGSKLLHLAHLTAAYSDILTLAAPHLAELAAHTGLSTFLGRREGDHSVHLLRVAGSERLAVTTPPGTRRLLSETGIGKALMLDDDEASWRRLFGLLGPQSRHPGWQDQMRTATAADIVLQVGPPPDMINSVAAPVRDAGGRIVAAINIAAGIQYVDRERMEVLAPMVLATARAISTELGVPEPATRRTRAPAPDKSA